LVSPVIAVAAVATVPDFFDAGRIVSSADVGVGVTVSSEHDPMKIAISKRKLGNTFIQNRLGPIPTDM
jgi:hypothetical protein